MDAAMAALGMHAAAIRTGSLIHEIMSLAPLTVTGGLLQIEMQHGATLDDAYERVLDRTFNRTSYWEQRVKSLEEKCRNEKSRVQARKILEDSVNKTHNPLLKKALKQFFAQDPNDLQGPGGFGPQQFVPAGQPLPYTIDFENDPTKANAPAQEVFVTHPLDPNLDLATFALTGFGWGSFRQDLPAGLQAYHTVVQTTNPDGSPLAVDVDIRLDPATRIVKWTFRSFDPATGDFPEDPLAGFLPPDDATGRGEGFVEYTIRTAANLPSGTAINQQASIVFDTNAALATNVFTNTLDAAAPSSSVTALPATQTSASFPVSWTGQDDAKGSGVATYDVYVSDNGGPFRPFRSATTDTSATYPGVDGHTYAFYSVATDQVGNRQAAPAGAQATTTVHVAAATTLTLATDHPAGAAFGQPVTLSATVRAAAGTPTGVVTFLDGTRPLGTAPLRGGTATFVTAALGLGRHSLSAAYAGDVGYRAAAPASATQIVASTAKQPGHRGKTVVVVGGSAGKDLIRITALPGGRKVRVEVTQKSGGHYHFRRDFPTTGLEKILVYGGPGQDRVEAGPGIKVPITLADRRPGERVVRLTAVPGGVIKLAKFDGKGGLPRHVFDSVFAADVRSDSAVASRPPG